MMPSKFVINNNSGTIHLVGCPVITQIVKNDIHQTDDELYINKLLIKSGKYYKKCRRCAPYWNWKDGLYGTKH